MNIDTQLDSIARELITAGITREQALESFERKFVRVALDLHGGNVSRTSAALGIHRNTLHNRIRELLGETRMAVHMRALRERRTRRRR